MLSWDGGDAYYGKGKHQNCVDIIQLETMYCVQNVNIGITRLYHFYLNHYDPICRDYLLLPCHYQHDPKTRRKPLSSSQIIFYPSNNIDKQMLKWL